MLADGIKRSWPSRVVEEMMSHLIPAQPVVDEDPDSQIARFYANRCIFITGGTGFIGKALVEKLLRSCKKIKRIYLLIREKRGKTIHERLDDLIQSQCFDRIRSQASTFEEANKFLKQKLYPIGGDITLSEFGISPDDMLLVTRDCSLVINSAATIRFVEPIDNAVRNNIYSVGQLIEFCNKLDHLEALVHLSTAYSNCHKRDTIHEIFYEPPMGGEQIRTAVETLKSIETNLHVYPNTCNRESPRKADSLTVCDDLIDPNKWLRDECDQQRFYFDKVQFPPSKHNPSNISAANTTAKANGIAHASPLANGNVDCSDGGGGYGVANYDLLAEFTRIALRRSNRPNTYAFTKAISENYLLDKALALSDRYLGEAGSGGGGATSSDSGGSGSGVSTSKRKIPIAIVRPSIVGGAWREPTVGLVDNFNGPTGACMAIYTGALQAMPGRGDRVADMVPVDMATNVVLAAGWFLVEGDPKAANIHRDEGVYIFNFVSGYRNPLKWGQVTQILAELSYKYPSKFLTRLPGSYFLPPGLLYEIYDRLNHMLPAYLIDFVRVHCFRQQLNARTSALAGYKRIKQMTETLTPFTSNQWRLSDANVCALSRLLNCADRRLFHFDVASIRWPEYLRGFIIGARIYTLRDEPDNVPKALRCLNRRRAASAFSITMLMLLVYYLFLKGCQLETFALSAAGFL